MSSGVPASAGQPAATATSITLDGTSGGRTFDGLGAVSGGSTAPLRDTGSGRCLDVPGAVRTNGTQWNLNADGTVTGVQSGICLAPNANSTANGAPMVFATCTGGNGQRSSRN